MAEGPEAQWRNGKMAQWQNGAMAQRLSGLCMLNDNEKRI